MMKTQPLETENVSAYYDTEKQMTFITYGGVLTAEVTGTLYKWVGELIAEIGADTARAVIFDFRAVTDFHRSNLPAANTHTRQNNIQHNNKTHPVALIVKTALQESMVRITTQLAGDEWRKKIVKSEQDAFKFIEAWHRKYPNRTAQTD